MKVLGKFAPQLFIPFALRVCMQLASDLLSEQLITLSTAGTAQAHCSSEGEFKRSACSEKKSNCCDSVVRKTFGIKAVGVEKKKGKGVGPIKKTKKHHQTKKTKNS